MPKETSCICLTQEKLSKTKEDTMSKEKSWYEQPGTVETHVRITPAQAEEPEQSPKGSFGFQGQFKMNSAGIYVEPYHLTKTTAWATSFKIHKTMRDRVCVTHELLSLFYRYTARGLDGLERFNTFSSNDVITELRNIHLRSPEHTPERALEVFNLVWAHTDEKVVTDYLVAYGFAALNSNGAPVLNVATDLLYPCTWNEETKEYSVYRP